MTRSSGGRVLVLLLVLIAASALAVVAYQVGVSAGVASVGTGASAAATHARGYGFAGGWGFPWFFVGPIFPILFILFFVLLLRAALWGRGPWHDHGWHEHGTDGPGRGLDEWHRRAHAGQSSSTEPRDPQAGGGR